MENNLTPDEDSSKDSKQNPYQHSNTSQFGLVSNIACMLCYVGLFISGIVFLAVEKKDQNIRFHAWQSTFFGLAVVVIWVIFFILVHIPILGFLFLLLSVVTGISLIIVWLITMIKAYQGDHWMIPIIGILAEQQVNKERESI